MPDLQHLFLVGEFSERTRLLSGLSFEQVTLRPEGASHSIYEELWHLVGYQQSIVEPGSEPSTYYPTAPPRDEQEWRDLVELFLRGARRAVALGNDPEKRDAEFAPGVTLLEELYSVAVHNAYHFGKIVGLRQRMNAWPPEETDSR